MSTSIKKVVVIGAGSMGSGIAAHLANAGMNVVLMDIVPKEGGRSSVAENAIQRQLATGGFMLPAYASLVRAANIEDDFADVADADWIVEAVIEDMAVKSNLYKSIEAVRKDDSIVSSNTSTIPLSHLTEGLGKRFAGDFLITHFFNPPRYMRLLELVSGPETHRSTVMRTRRICDEVLGKTVIDCRDKPGFIANRIGNYWMSVATLEAIKHGLTVEEADAVMSRGFGVPKTGIFGLFDLVGINLVPLVWRSLLDILLKDDDHHHFDLTKNSFIGTMLEKGLIGRKGKGGFYRQTGKGKDRIRETIDLNSGEYRLEQSPTLDALDTAGKNLRKLCEHDSAAGRYAWSVLKHLVCYSSEVAPSVADDVISVDTAMQLGYNWSEGPFQLADRAGTEWIAAKIKEEGGTVPPLLGIASVKGGFYLHGGTRIRATDGSVIDLPKKEGILSIADIKRTALRVDGNDSASLWDLGGGVLGLDIHTKMNACDVGVIEAVELAVKLTKQEFGAIVVGNDHSRAFSAGANLSYFVDMIERKNWTDLEKFVIRGQRAFMQLKYAEAPVVAAAFGLTLGGGCELMMHCDVTLSHSELNAGFPELNVGIVPGWGGCTQLILRTGGDAASIERAFKSVVSTRISSSAAEAVELGVLRATDPIIMNRDRLLAQAVQQARSLIELPYHAPASKSVTLGGAKAKNSLLAAVQPLRQSGALSDNDWAIVSELATIFSGGESAEEVTLSETDLSVLERTAFMRLASRPATLERMKHMLATGKPLRN